MEKKVLYEKAEKAINQAFEVAKQSIKVVSEKAGEAAHITKLLIDKAALEHRITKKFAEIGHCVYEEAVRPEKQGSGEERVKALIEEAKKLDTELQRTEVLIEKENKALKTVSKSK